MPLSSSLKAGLNGCLRKFNLQISTLTSEQVERARLEELTRRGQFAKQVFPILRQFQESSPDWILPAVDRFKDAIARFSTPRENAFSFDNPYFTGSDAEVAYAIVREVQPRRIIEVGSGNSTMLFREAIRDGRLMTELVSIDPVPRRSIDAISDRTLKKKLEDVSPDEFQLAKNDILFIDSSHEIRVGNDVIRLFLNVLPQLAAGVIIHIHDIFLPYEYPQEWILTNRWAWNEQYLVQALLQDSQAYDVLWAGHYFQRHFPDLSKHFGAANGTASSLWLRKRPLRDLIET